MSRPQNSYTNAAFCQQSEFYKSPNRRQSPVGAQTVHILDTSIRSIQNDPLPPRPGPKPLTAKYVDDGYEEEQEFYEEMIVDDRGAVQEKKFVVVHNQPRYDYIPLQQPPPPQRIASPPKVLYHEEVDASTGRLHRYATIPSDDELEEIERRQEKEDNGKRYALVPVEELRNQSRYAVVTQESVAASRYEYIPERVGHQLPQQVLSPQPRRPPPNPVATQKLHELLTTPKKKLQLPMSPISPIQQAVRTPNGRPGSAPRAQQKLNYALSTRQPQDTKRHTAIVAPICSSPVQSVYSETTFSNKTESSLNVSLRKAPAQASIAIAAFMMILCGSVTTGLCLYMISYMGRIYYLDFGILSGFICFLLGLLGFRSRHIYWLPNRNYISGYFVLSVFSLLTCVGLLVLLFMQPKPGTLIADMTSGAVCGISGLSLFLASIGVVASYCCNVPPPDNRVEHCAPSFKV